MQSTMMTITQEDLLEIVDNLANAVLIINGDYQLVFVNSQARQIIGRPKHEVIGRGVGEALGCKNAAKSPDGCGYSPECKLCRVLRLIQGAFADKTAALLSDVEMVSPVAGRRTFKIGAQYVYLGIKEVVLLSMEDMTEVKEKVRLHLENARLTAAVETATAVCHELNQPLMVMAGYAEMLLDARTESDEDYGMLRRLIDEIGRINAISKKLMGLSKYRTTSYAGVSRMLDLSRSSPAAAAS